MHKESGDRIQESGVLFKFTTGEVITLMNRRTRESAKPVALGLKFLC